MKYTYLILAMSFLMFSCQREELELDVKNEVVTGDPMVKVDGSVVGLVTDGAGEPVDGATVSLGNITRTTNEFGVFTFVDQELFEDGTYIKVDKPGYFAGSRRFNALADEQNNIRIRLIEKIQIGSVSAGTGGSLNVSTASIEMPAGAYTTSSGDSYNGDVKVFAKYLDPTAAETFEEMPGDLVGIDSEGSQNALATFGMLAVELENDNGEELNLPEGTTATLRIAVPDAILSVAPQVIPLWHFDETQGIWLEEGEANLENGVYVGDVEHFSYWNCDYPLPTVDINGTVSINGSLANGVKVQVIDQTTGFMGCGYTTSRGMFSGGVPAGNVLIIRVLDPCGGIMYEAEIGPFTVDTDLGLVDFTTALANVMLSGVVTNCTGQPMTESAVVFDFGLTDMVVLCEDDGSFNFLTPPCLNGQVDVYGLDLTNSLISPEATINFSGTQDVGTLIACEDYIEEGFIIEYDNKNWGDSSLDSALVGYSIEIDSFINGATTNVVLTFTMIDWIVFDQNDNLVQYIGEYSYTVGEDTAQLNGTFESQGFTVNGTSSYEEINQAGQKYVRFNYSTTDVQEVESSLFPGDVGEVNIFLTIPIN